MMQEIINDPVNSGLGDSLYVATEKINANFGNLSNVDNTSDANKPISNATQTALDAKYDKTGGLISGNVTVNGSVTANSIIKQGGNVTQYLMADGSTTTTAPSSGLKIKKLQFNTPGMNAGYNSPTNITDGTMILQVTPYLQNLSSTFGYAVGDIINVSPVQANDSGGLADSGIQVSFRQDLVSEVKWSINNSIDINPQYNGAVGTASAIANPNRVGDLNAWAVVLIIFYI